MKGKTPGHQATSSFAALLRRLRLDAGLSQEELAGIAGVSARSISDLERGINRTARKETARLLADGLSLTGPARETFEETARGRPPLDAVRADPDPGSADSLVAATRTLPRDIASFTGREAEVVRLVTEVADAADTEGSVSVCVIGGMAGIGKTALAVHAAHLLERRFPDGQIFLPLHGHTPGHRPVDATDALASLLQSAGVAPRQIPAGVEERTRLWRDRIAGRRLLLLLDDTAGHEQVRPLLPGTSGSLVLITSRRHLTALEDVHLISLDTLSPDEASRLLARLAGRPGLTTQDSAVRHITRLCGYLPLAIGMLARQLHHHPVRSVASLADDLAAARSRLQLMHAENLSVTAAFDMSYQELDPAKQLMFRRLGLHPGIDIDRYAAAALSGATLDHALRQLEGLYDHYLLSEPTPGRYRFHDLIGEHARILAAADTSAECSEATDRLLEYFLRTVRSGVSHLARRTPICVAAPTAAGQVLTPDLSQRQDATSWMDTERVNLHAAVAFAAAGNRPDYAIALPTAMHGYLRHQGHWDQVLSLHHIALRVARGTSDKPAEANALTDLGDIQYLAGDYELAADSLNRALSLYRIHQDTRGEANALTILAYVQHLIGENRDAVANLRTAVSLYRERDDQLGLAGALAYLGNVQRAIGEYGDARANLTESATIHAATGNTVRQAGALNFLGLVETVTGNEEAAAAHQTRSLELYRGLGNRFGEANALRDLGFAQLALRDYTTATATLHQAIRLQVDLSSRMGEAKARYYLGVAQRLTNDYPAALASLSMALRLHRGIGIRLGETEDLNALGELALCRGDAAEATALHEQALVIATAITARPEQARALEGVGRCQLSAGHLGKAAATLDEALAVYQTMESPNGERIAEFIRASEIRRSLPITRFSARIGTAEAQHRLIGRGTHLLRRG